MGYAFYDVTVKRTENILKLTDPRFEALLSETNLFKPEEYGMLFDRSFLKQMIKEAFDHKKLRSLGRSGGANGTSSSSTRPKIGSFRGFGVTGKVSLPVPALIFDTQATGTAGCGSQGGNVRKQLEQATGQFCQLGSTTRSSIRRRVQPELEVAKGICVPSFLFNSEVPDESDGGKSGSDAGDSAVAGTAVVLYHSRTARRDSSHSSVNQSPFRPVG